MVRKFGLALLAVLLVLLPVSAAFGKEAHAAASSRIAIIKSLSGDVQVQKAGGSKQFKAFAKLSLNQGDKLVTGSEGSAVLQFSNGTSEDDKFTVGENATLTFSKLSDRKGTVTKVSMLKGTAWVDVKSIKSKDDDFRLETPTAVMGVRGTAFYASVNPATGGTTTAVLSGIVRYTWVGGTQQDMPASAGRAGSEERPKGTIDLYPARQLAAQPGDDTDLPGQVRLIDIEEIVRSAPPEVIEAMLRSKGKIDQENEEMTARFQANGKPDALNGTLDAFIRHTQEMLGVIAKQAIDQRKIDLAGLRLIELQENASFNLTKDRLALTETEREQQRLAREKEAAAAKQKAAADTAKKQELQERLAGQLQAIETAKLAQVAANRKAAAESSSKAEAALLSGMTDMQRQQYGKDKAVNAGGLAPTPTPYAGNEPTPTATPTATPTTTPTATPTTVPTATPTSTPTTAPTSTPTTVPVAMAAYVETDYQTPVAGTLSSYGGSGAVTYEIVRNGEHGSVTLGAAGSAAFTYTPEEGFSGVDSFEFRAIAGGVVSAPATVAIYVKPFDFELKGLSSSAVVWGEQPVEPYLLGSFADGSYRSKSYGVFVDDSNRLLDLTFAFDPAVVTDAQLVYDGGEIEQEPNGTLHGSFALKDAVNSIRLQYSAAVDDRTIEYEVNYIVIGRQQWAANLRTGGQAEVHLVPVGNNTYTASVRTSDDTLLLRSETFEQGVKSGVWYYKPSDPGNPGSPATRTPVQPNGEGKYPVPLAPGWNKADISLFYQGHEENAREGVVYIWRGDSVPDGYALTSLKGTPVQDPPQASTAPVAFIRDASLQSVYRVAMPEDTVQVKVKPVPADGMKIDAVYYGGYDAFKPAEESPTGSGVYLLPMSVDTIYYGFVVVSPVSGSGPPLAYKLDVSLGLTLELTARLGYIEASQPKSLELWGYSGGLQGELDASEGQRDFNLIVDGPDRGSEVWVNGVRAPYDAMKYAFVYPFSPEPGSQTLRIEATDAYGRYASREIRFFYGVRGERLTPPGLASWSTHTSGEGGPAQPVSWVYDGQNRFHMTVVEDQDHVQVQWSRGEGSVLVRMGPGGISGTESYTGSLPMGRSDYVLEIRDESGLWLQYDLAIYRGAPVYPRLTYSGWGSSVMFQYDEETDMYVASIDNYPGNVWVRLNLPAGAEAELTVGGVPYEPNSDGLYALQLPPENDELAVHATVYFEQRASSCDLLIRYAAP